MTPVSLFRSGHYSTGWIKDFYTQAGIWWGAEPHDDPGDHRARAAIVERLHGPGKWRVLDLGAGSGFTAAALADAGHAVVGVELNPTDIAYAQELLAIPRPGSLSIVEGDYYTVELDGQEVDFSSDRIALSEAMLEAWAYLAQLVPAGGAG